MDKWQIHAPDFCRGQITGITLPLSCHRDETSPVDDEDGDDVSISSSFNRLRKPAYVDKEAVKPAERCILVTHRVPLTLHQESKDSL